eukprot:SM000238S08043  [mRNA]  locus=s238:44288:46172:+ [translate_table: standard]
MAFRDKRTLAFQLVIPVLFITMGVILLLLKPQPDQHSLTLTTSSFTRFSGICPLPMNCSQPIARACYEECGCKRRSQDNLFPSPQQTLEEAVEAAGADKGPPLMHMSEYLIASRNLSAQSRYGEIVFHHSKDGVRCTVLHNSSCQHAAVTCMNTVNEALLRLASASNTSRIITKDHSLPQTMSQHRQRRDIGAFSAAIISNVAFSFNPASFAIAIVKERELKLKHQQLLSGVSTVAYWISTLIWDSISIQYALAPLLSCVYEFIGDNVVLPTILLMGGRGPAVAAVTYCLTFLFSDHSAAQNMVLVHFFTGLMVTSFIMSLIPATEQLNELLLK